MIAPLSANTLAKISNGLCDNLCVFDSDLSTDITYETRANLTG